MQCAQNYCLVHLINYCVVVSSNTVDNWAVYTSLFDSFKCYTTAGVQHRCERDLERKQLKFKQKWQLLVCVTRNHEVQGRLLTDGRNYAWWLTSVKVYA